MAPTLRHGIGLPPWPPPPGCSSRAPGRTRSRAPSGAAPRAAPAGGWPPAPGEPLGPIADGDREDARRAVAAAKAAFPKWEKETAFARADYLRRIADICERRRDELAKALTLDQGKPLQP